MVEKYWPLDVLREENVCQHRSQVCDLFLYLRETNKNETIYFFKEQFRIWKCI